MKKSIISMIVLLAIMATSSCKKNENNSSSFEKRGTMGADYAQSVFPVKTVSGDITVNTVWDKDTVYELSGVVTVRNNATLLIEPCCYIKSVVNVPGVPNGILVIAKDGNINAQGNPCCPIVFTSRYLLDGIPSTKGTPGDIGGVIILGDAIINAPGGDKLIEGLPDSLKYHYGGQDNLDDRGTLRYVRIEFAGFKLADNIEVNSLTCGGVGSLTDIDHVQVSYGLDDGFEFFGGTVNPTHLVSFANDDDFFDFDNGYTGTIQYAIGSVDAYSTHSASGGVSDANGIEADNNSPFEDPSFSLLPKTHPILNNFTIVGTRLATMAPPITPPGLRSAFRLRRCADATVNNSLFTGYPSGIVADPCCTLSTSNVATSATSPASPLGMVQPFFNDAVCPGVPNFAAAGTRGAVIPTSGNWLTCWTKFCY